MILWMCWNPENFLEKKWTLIYTNNNIKNAFRRLENPRIESRMCQNNLTGIKTHETTSWKGVGEKALTQLRKWVVLLRLNAKGTAPAPPHSCVIVSHGVQGAVPVPLHTLPGAELSTGGQQAGPFPYWKGRSVLCVVATKCLQVSRLNKKKQQGKLCGPQNKIKQNKKQLSSGLQRHVLADPWPEDLLASSSCYSITKTLCGDRTVLSRKLEMEKGITEGDEFMRRIP